MNNRELELKGMTDLMNRNEIHETFSFGVIYIYSIPDERHKGRLKIGSASFISKEPTYEEIEAAARYRIDQQTVTADVPYVLEHAELAITDDSKYFSDTHVHEVLIRSGFTRRSENTKNTRSEWFEIDLATAKKAIYATRKGRAAISASDIKNEAPIGFPFRPNQLDAIHKTTKAIRKNRTHFLWNAKMRFGKTSAAMQVAKENEMKKVLIVTHRPSVSIDWYDDFSKVFAGTNYAYASKTKGEHISTLIKEDKPFVYFASLQDLRLSRRVVADEAANTHARGFDKNDEVFDTTWDMLIVDEAHEGTQSDLGDATFTKIPASFTLQLSGTPFNILHKHEESDIYTWDYVMEQEQKLHWDERHPGVPNPYTELPALSMFTYDIKKFEYSIGSIEGFTDQLDGAFKFHEFFRVEKDADGNDTAQFVHEGMINKFLDLLVDHKQSTSFPFSTEEYRSYIKHSLWLLPNRIKVIEAMEKLLRNHSMFSKFGIINISGDAKDDDSAETDAKSRVKTAIRENEYTITLTGQRLTTGASIPEWSAVFMMSDTNSATTYLQTAFRCQTPAMIDGKLKTQGYIFDFAPDRTLKLVAEAIELNHKSGKINTPEQKQAMGDFLNFCPILSAEGGSMKRYDVSGMLEQLKKAVIERVSRNGFDDPKLYNDELLHLDELDITKFNKLKEIVGKATNERVNEIEINNLGMDELETSKAEDAERKKKQKKELSEEEKDTLRKLKEAREQKNTAVSILRAVSIRMPMMVYGANVSMKEDITLQKFIDLVDDESWLEFMPKGLSKETFREFTKYYDEEIFRGVARSIRAKAFDCDDLLPTERIQAISEIFGTFKNPDKETVLTPWNVVNMQMTMTLGGHDFRTINSKSGKPEWINQDGASGIWSKDDTKILEINSKSGLYPLLAAYNIYSRELIKLKKPEDKIFRQLWKKILTNNIYVLCKSPMAMTITLRTLTGYSGNKTNIAYIKDLVKKLRQEDSYNDYNFKNELHKKFGIEDKNMKFTAVVGNPPYQVADGSGGSSDSAIPVYGKFFEAAKLIDPDYICLITPSKWMVGGRGLKKFRENMINDRKLRVIVDYENAAECFPGVHIDGGISYFLWQQEYEGDVEYTYHSKEGDIKKTKRTLKNDYFEYVIRDNRVMTILEKTQKDDRFSSIVSNTRPFGIRNYLFNSPERYPESSLKDEEFKNSIKIHGVKGIKGGARRVVGYINRDTVTRNAAYIDEYKLFFTTSFSTNAIEPPDAIEASPGTVCTETFLVVGPFNNRSEQKNCHRFMKTNFFKALLYFGKGTMHVTKSVFGLIPLQDFSSNSTIDWSLPINEIDKQLYAKYKLKGNEINFIEKHVNVMQ